MEAGISIFNGIAIEKQVELMNKYNMKRTFVGSERNDFDYVMKLFSENGIICETLHAPFNNINDMWKDDKSGDEMLARLTDGVDKCHKYGIPVIIIHLSSKTPMPEITEAGVARFDKLYEYAKEKNVTIAYENQRYMENLTFMLERHKEAGLCWDNGHEAALAVDRTVRTMPVFGHRTVALHIHDNCGETNKDNHVLPFDGKLDLERDAREIAESGYKGTLMLEVGKTVKYYDEAIYESLTEEEYFVRALNAVKKLAELVDSYSV